MAARTSCNVLKSARVRRESCVGPWLPEPLPTGPDAAGQVLTDDLVGTAMLVVMEELSPAERVALVLHDVFDLPFGQIAEVLGSTPAASRKLASRARARVARLEGPPRASRAETERVLKAFKAAADAGIWLGSSSCGGVAGTGELRTPAAPMGPLVSEVLEAVPGSRRRAQLSGRGGRSGRPAGPSEPAA